MPWQSREPRQHMEGTDSFEDVLQKVQDHASACNALLDGAQILEARLKALREDHEALKLEASTLRKLVPAPVLQRHGLRRSSPVRHGDGTARARSADDCDANDKLSSGQAGRGRSVDSGPGSPQRTTRSRTPPTGAPRTPELGEVQASSLDATGSDSDAAAPDTCVALVQKLVREADNMEQQRNLRALQALLRKYPDMQTRWAGPGEPPLSTVVKAGRIDLTRMLLLGRADVNAQDDKGVSALHLATYDGNVDLCKVLVASRASPDIRDRHGQTPLFFAPNKDICKLLIERRADLTLLNRKGQTSLHLAGRAGLQDVLSWLASRAGPVLTELKDGTGQTAFDYAQQAAGRSSGSLPQRSRARGISPPCGLLPSVSELVEEEGDSSEVEAAYPNRGVGADAVQNGSPRSPRFGGSASSSPPKQRSRVPSGTQVPSSAPKQSFAYGRSISPQATVASKPAAQSGPRYAFAKGRDRPFAANASTPARGLVLRQEPKPVVRPRHHESGGGTPPAAGWPVSSDTKEALGPGPAAWEASCTSSDGQIDTPPVAISLSSDGGPAAGGGGADEQYNLYEDVKYYDLTAERSSSPSAQTSPAPSKATNAADAYGEVAASMLQAAAAVVTAAVATAAVHGEEQMQASSRSMSLPKAPSADVSVTEAVAADVCKPPDAEAPASEAQELAPAESTEEAGSEGCAGPAPKEAPAEPAQEEKLVIDRESLPVAHEEKENEEDSCQVGRRHSSLHEVLDECF